MNEIIAHLKESIADEILSKQERKTLRELVVEHKPGPEQLNFLRSKIYELANEKVTDGNYRFILEWVKNVNSALLPNDKAEMSDAYFSPGESCREIIINQISTALTRIKICVFTISDDRISNAILTSHKRGVEVRVITDNDKSLDIGSDIHQLVKSGISVKMDSTPNHMHHKFMVVDDKELTTGSYNWTQSAARFNHENILVTKETGVVKSFLKEFEQLWKQMELYR